MDAPVYTFFYWDAQTEADLRHRIAMLRYGSLHAHRFGDHGWINIRVDGRIFDIEEHAIEHIQRFATDLETCCAVQYRVPPDSTRLRGAQLKLRKLVEQLNCTSNQLRLQKKIAAQRQKIVGIKQELASKSIRTQWIVGGLLRG